MRPRRTQTERHTPGEGTFGDVLGHSFYDPDLLTWALTHRSLSYERAPEESAKPTGDNEQLEFVGDAVLGLIVAEGLFRRFPDSREGELTRLRATLVSRKHLAEVGARIGLGARLLLGRGEEGSGGRSKPALLSNALEAVIAALYLDGGLEVARAFIDRVIIFACLTGARDRALVRRNLQRRDRRSQVCASGAHAVVGRRPASVRSERPERPRPPQAVSCAGPSPGRS